MLSQKDLRWANDKINGTQYTLKTDGCLISCLADIAGITPGEANQRLGFRGALLDWNSVGNIGLQLVERLDRYDNNKAKQALANGLFPVIRVDFDGNPRTASDYHFVRFIGNKQMGDPIDGKIKSTSAYRILNGMRIVRKIG